MAARHRQMPRFPGLRLNVLVPVALIAIGLVGLTLHEPVPPPLVGAARAVDGDTIRLAGERIRLLGIDAPELEQTCKDARGADWPCGDLARREMAGLLAGATLSCVPAGHDVYGRLLARCSRGSDDLGATMVRAGLAVADGDYWADQSAAQRHRIGIWAGTFERPAEWRRGQGGNGADQNLIDIVRSWFR